MALDPNGERNRMSILINRTAELDASIARMANCGCVYQAEQGIPCEHDLELYSAKLVKRATEKTPVYCEDFAIFGTQFGGLARAWGDQYLVFIKKPDCSGLDVGDKVPDDWSIAPVNHRAKALAAFWEERAFGA